MSIASMRSSLTKAWPVMAIFALAVFLRLYRLPQLPPGLHADEAMNGINALEAWRSSHFEVFYPENGGREGLLINLQAVALGLIGRNEAWVPRLVSALFGILTVVAFYYFCREIVDESTGRLAALFMATSVWHITLSRFGTRPIASLFFLLWSLYLFWRSARRLAEGSRWYWLDAVGAGLFYGLGFHTYTAFRITPLIVAAVLPQMVRRFGRSHVAKVTAIFAALTILAVWPIALYFLHHQADFTRRASQISVFAYPHAVRHMLFNFLKTAGMYTIAGDDNWRHNTSGHRMLSWPVALLFLFGTGLAVRRYRWLLVFWIAGALPCILTSQAVPHALRSILTLPAVLLAAALGGIWLWRRLVAKYPQPAWQVIPYALAGILAVAAYRSYFVEWGADPLVAAWYDENATLEAQRLLTLPREVPKYVVFMPDGTHVRGLPSSARSIMFLTDTFTMARQKELHIHYLLLEQISQIESGQVYKVLVPPPGYP